MLDIRTTNTKSKSKRETSKVAPTKKAFEFPNEEALKQYLNEHPKADRSLHYVKKQEPSKPAFKPTVPTHTFSYFVKRHLLNNPNRKEWEQSLNTEEKKVIEKYSNMHYKRINKFLRGSSSDTTPESRESLKKEVDILDAALRRNKTTKSVVVWRGSHLNPHLKEELSKVLDQGMNPTDIVLEDPAFTSTSSSRDEAESFREESEEGVLFRIVLPKGTHGAFLDENLSYISSEKEFLLPTGCQFRFTKVAKGNYGSFNVECELINNFEGERD